MSEISREVTKIVIRILFVLGRESVVVFGICGQQGAVVSVLAPQPRTCNIKLRDTMDFRTSTPIIVTNSLEYELNKLRSAQWGVKWSH